MHDYPTPLHLLQHAEQRWRDVPGDALSASYHAVEVAQVSGVEVGQPRRPLGWVSALHRYEQFWREGGRSARENTRNREKLPAPERRLGEWARYQRRYRDELCAYHVIRLDVSPAFHWDPQEAAWSANLAACERHRRRTGALPHLNQDDAVEFALARWLNRQLDQLRAGTLLEYRARALQGLLRD